MPVSMGIRDDGGESKEPDRPQSGSLKPFAKKDPPLTELLVPPPGRHERAPASSSEEQGRKPRKQATTHRYSNVELPEVVSPDHVRSQLGERGQNLEEAQRPSIGRGEKYFVSRTEYKENTVDEEGRNLPNSSATTLYTLSHLIFFSILGTLARLGVEAITFYPSAPVISPVLWANLGGSLALGFLTEDRRIFREEWGIFSSSEYWSFHPTIMESDDAERVQNAFRNHGKVKKTIPLYIGLATGFCGSFTSFSTFIRDAFLALGNGLESPWPNPGQVPSRSGGYSFEALLAIIIIHIAVSLCALEVGAHLAFALDPIIPTLRFKAIRRILDPFIVCAGLGSWVAAVFLAVFPPHPDWRGRVVLALVFAPLGCLLRFYASKYLNPRIPSFPLGTFAVNMFGTIVLGVCFDLQHSVPIAPRYTSCQVLQGVMEGFCGCTTTVSTWVAELDGLKRRHSYIYGFLSVTIALLFLVVIMGSLQWSHGFQRPVCA